MSMCVVFELCFLSAFLAFIFIGCDDSICSSDSLMSLFYTLFHDLDVSLIIFFELLHHSVHSFQLLFIPLKLTALMLIVEIIV